MKPIVLTMQAFGSYGNKTTIDFTKPTQNLFLVTGDTGAGKSTIFDAIVFALYGEASSSSNKKDGTELQSQYVGYGTKPFVELTFSEAQGGENQVYTVRRTPRHLRPLKKGNGVKEEKESVCLILPDGSEYSQNQKETDGKLEQIVGLTKSQFMQVAMIAQGEFMELLRADSNKKREIFRKLFHTEQYRDIVEELKRRRENKQAQILQIRTICQTEAGHITLPPFCPDTQELADLQRRVCTGDRLNPVELEQLLEQLESLCSWLTEQRAAAEGESRRAGTLRDQARDACRQAETLLSSYAQLESADAQLLACAEEAPQMQAHTLLLAQMQNAYEVQAVYRRCADGEKAVEDTQVRLQAQQQLLPGLTELAAQAEAEARQARQIQEKTLEACTALSHRVTHYLEVLERIRQAQAQVRAGNQALSQAEADTNSAKAALETLEKNRQRWQAQIQDLSGVPEARLRWETQKKAAQTAAQEWQSLREREQSLARQRERSSQAQADYIAARQAFAQATEAFLNQQTRFLDAQAGFLAREKLKPGLPCPVCGSREHPAPCLLPEDLPPVSREQIDALAAEAARRQEALTKASALAGAEENRVTELARSAEDSLLRLRRMLAEHLPEQIENWTAEQAGHILDAWSAQLDCQGTRLQEQADALAQARNSLETIDETKLQLADALAQAEARLSDAKAQAAAGEAALESYRQQLDFPDEAAARQAQAQANRERTQADSRYTAARQTEQEAIAAREAARAQIRRCQEDLPGLLEELAQRKAAYHALLEAHALSESQWQEVVLNHEKGEMEVLRNLLHTHATRKAAAEGARDTALAAIAGRPRPDKPQLEENLAQAESQWQTARERQNALAAAWETNTRALVALSSQREERTRLAREFAQVDSLYQRLSGKVSGARMDIETYVQRCYLQRILAGANLRLGRMSAGQFEMRLVSESQAGEGKNRGLDLMVYSTVTGKEREVRTLSGGESFLAALSLALGMADQIQERTASIHLDILFVDEGFGSLDDHARSQAVKVLRQMAGGEKLIGIISHVSELKQEIENQLAVTKDRDGSHVRWSVS